MYMELQDLKNENWGKEAWQYHRDTFGHQSEVGYKELCHMWKTEKFDAEATIKQFKKWGARYVAIIDNFDLFNDYSTRMERYQSRAKARYCRRSCCCSKTKVEMGS